MILSRGGGPGGPRYLDKSTPDVLLPVTSSTTDT
jgi:hypothetical protein